MQAIARVNRVFRDKPGGLVVDYLGTADQLKRALSDYTEGDRREAGVPQEEAVAVLQEKFEVVEAMLHGFEYTKFFTGTSAEKMGILPRAMEHVLAQEDGKARYVAVAVSSRPPSRREMIVAPRDPSVEDVQTAFERVAQIQIAPELRRAAEPAQIAPEMTPRAAHAVRRAALFDVRAEVMFAERDALLVRR